MQFDEATHFISDLLQTQLPAELYYHNYEHTFNVLQAVTELAKEEHIINEHDLIILKTAAWFHDSGYINTYEHHEEESCRISRKHLTAFDYNNEQIEKICSLIMKTKMPQQPQIILEKILCDADLDYLGRNDFMQEGQKLLKEWIAVGKMKDESEWNEKQIKFLESHSYWTQSARQKRNRKKAEYLKQLKISAF